MNFMGCLLQKRVAVCVPLLWRRTSETGIDIGYEKLFGLSRD